MLMALPGTGRHKPRNSLVIPAKLTQHLSLPWAQCFDGKSYHSPAVTKVGITRIPSNILVDRKGCVRYVDCWGRRLRQAIVDLLRER